MPITLRNIPAVDVPTPDPDKITLFTDTDDLLYSKDDTGAVSQIGGGGGSGTVTSVDAIGNNGVTVSGGPITTTGSLTFGLDAITPNSVAAVGTVTGSNLSGTNTGDQTITLTGDVTGSGTSSFATTLSDTSVIPGSYTNADITIDSKGRITAAANGSAGGTVTSITVDGTTGNITSTGSPITASGTITLDLATTAVTPGSYTSADITVDSFGRITAATNGSGGGGVVEPLNQIIIGTGTGATSFSTATYNGVSYELQFNVDPFSFPVNSKPLEIPDPGNIMIYAASNDGSGSSFRAGSVYMLAGLCDNFNPTAVAGEVIIRSGRNQNGTGAQAGASEILMTTHNGNNTSSTASNFLVLAGSTNNGGTPTGPRNGGVVDIKAGSGRNIAGSFNITAGNSTGLSSSAQTAGDVNIYAGNVTGNTGSGSALGTAGSIFIGAGRNLNPSGTHGSITFETRNNARLIIGPDGDIDFGSGAGTAGQLLASGGPGASPIWSNAFNPQMDFGDPKGGEIIAYDDGLGVWISSFDGRTFQTFLFSDNADHDMDGAENSSWTVSQPQGNSTICSISGETIVFNNTGTYELIFYSSATCTNGDGNWPDTSTGYGITITGSTGVVFQGGSMVGYHFRFGTPGGNAALNSLLGGGSQTSQFTDRGYVQVNPGAVMKMNMRVANPDDTSRTYQGNITVRIRQVDQQTPS